MNVAGHSSDHDLASRLRKRWFRRAEDTMVVPVVLSGYSGPNFLRNHRRALLALFGLFAFLYGAVFGIYGTFMMLQLCVPLVILLILSIWLLPDTGRAPTNAIVKLLFTFIAVVVCWPNYLAIALPGMPWITMIRLAAVPLATVMLVALSVSGKLRREMKAILSAVPLVWKFLVAFVVISLLSIAVSEDRGGSANKFVVAQLYWTLIFFAACYVFAQPGKAIRFAYLMWMSALFVSVIGVQEWRHSAVPWAGHIPSFLQIDDDSVNGILAGGGRAATGIYRVKSVFSTPLGLSEFLALATPFVWFVLLTDKRPLVKLAAFVSIPFIFFVLTRTDSRLGMVGFFLTALLYILGWGALRWRDRPEGVAGRLTVTMYPVIAGTFFVLSLFWRRLHVMIWGGGATNPSSAARRAQWAMGMPKIYSHPWGYGAGQGGSTLGYVGGGGKLTIDTYYLSVGLEYGAIGFILYFGMFLAAIYFGAWAALRSTDRETRLLIPLLIALANFTIIKSVFSQESNHPIVFCILGIVVALVYRVEGTAGHTRRVSEILAGKRIGLPGRRPVLAHAKVTSASA